MLDADTMHQPKAVHFTHTQEHYTLNTSYSINGSRRPYYWEIRIHTAHVSVKGISAFISLEDALKKSYRGDQE